MTIHVYHPYRQPDGFNYCQAVNGHCSHLCLPAPKINERSPKISCACPTGLKLMDDGLMCVEDGKFFFCLSLISCVCDGFITYIGLNVLFFGRNRFQFISFFTFKYYLPFTFN